MSVQRLAIQSTPQSVLPIYADKIWAIGGTIEGRQKLTWSPVHPSGWLPIQCYLLRDGNESLIVDTGVSVHRDQIFAGLSDLLSGLPPPRMTMTRWESDSIINLPKMLKAFDINSVLWSGPLNPLDFFEGVEKASVDAHMKATTGVTLDRTPPGELIKVGNLTLEIIRTNLTVLITYWFYERQTRTLFSSDSFGFIPSRHAGGPQQAENARSHINAQNIADYLRTKFDWLIGIDTAPIAKELLSFFDSRSIDRICPSFGCVIEGEDLVQLVKRETVSALAILARDTRPSALQGLDLKKLAQCQQPKAGSGG